MKTNVFSLIVIALIVGTSCQENIDVEKEKEAVKTAIDRYINHWNEIDYEGFVSDWVDESYTFESHIGIDGHLNVGRKEAEWESGFIKGAFTHRERVNKESGESWIMEPSNIFIKVYKQTAWATINIKHTTFKEKEETEEVETYNIYFFEKRNGEWKIAFTVEVDESSFEEYSKTGKTE